MEILLHDLRHAFRALFRARGFTTAAVLSLALGIGANTAIFTIFNSALLRPLPVEAPEQLVRLITERGDNDNLNFSYPHYTTLRDARAFDGLVAHTGLPAALRVGNTTEEVSGAAVSNDFFQVLGLRAAAGRVLHPDEPLQNPVVVLSHLVWRRLFDGETSAIGATVQLNGKPFTVVGIAQDDFTGLIRGQNQDFWIPLGAYALVTGSDFINHERSARISWLDVVARLQPGLTIEATEARLGALNAPLRERGILANEEYNRLESAQGGFDWAVSELEQPLVYLTAAVALVLLIACANVANLLLVRATARRRDLAIRVAMGSSRGRLVRQMLTESMLLALLAGGIGLIIAIWVSDAVATYRPSIGVPLALDTTPDGPVLIFTFTVSLLTGLIFGAGPALHTVRTDLMSLLKQGTLRGAGGWFARNTLVVTQVALSLVLLVGAALLGRSLQQLGTVPLGYDTRNALLASIDLEAAQYDAGRGQQFIVQLLERLRAMPGVVDASAASTINPSPAGSNYSGVIPEGYTGPIEDVSLDVNVVADRYFSTMGVQLVSGRVFDANDRAVADPLASGAVVIINEEGARRYFPGVEPIGKRIWLDSIGGRYWTVIGVARDSKLRYLREERTPNIWRPLAQAYRARINLILHTRADPMLFANVLRSELRALDPAVPLADVHTLEQHIGYASSQERMATRLAAGFSMLALALAAIGLYGLLAYFVTQRTREIGVRMALGAHRSDVLRQVMRHGLTLVAIGVAVGLPVALWTTRLLASMLFGVSPTDLRSFVLAAAVLMVAGTIAMLLPARRATAVDPMIALRAE